MAAGHAARQESDVIAPRIVVFVSTPSAARLAWVRDASRRAITHQRYLTLSIVGALADGLLVLPVVAAAAGYLTLDDAVRAVARPDTSFTRALAAATSTRLTVAAVVILGALIAAVVRAPLIAGLNDEAFRAWHGLATTLRLVALYAVPPGLFLAAEARSSVRGTTDAIDIAAGVTATVIMVLLLFADYIVVIRRTGLVNATRTSLRILRRASLASLTLLACVFAAEALISVGLAEPLAGADRLFAAGLIAIVLARATIAFLSDSAAISLANQVLEVP